MTTVATSEPTRKSSRIAEAVATSFRRYSAAWLLVTFVIVFSITAPDTFPTVTTFRLVLSDQVTGGMVAMALLIPLAAGAFDLSIGAAIAFGAVIVSTLVREGWNPVPAAIVAVVACGAVGALNGFVVVKLHVNSFIATLGTGQLLNAGMLRVSTNKQISGVFPEWFRDITRQKLLGLGYEVYYLVILALVVWYVLEFTPVGRALFATGGNAKAARLAGVDTEKMIWGSLVASAALAGFAGVLLMSKNLLFTPSIGPSYLFPSFAAVFFGATQIKGRPNVWGTLLAMYSLAAGVSGLQLTFFGNEYWITPLFNGLALLIAVSLASLQMKGRAARQSGKIRSET